MYAATNTCAPQIFDQANCGRERIFVMQAAQYRFDAQHQAPADLMTG